MKTKILLLTLIAILFFSCSETENPIDDGKRLTPLALLVDINDDGAFDFKIEYNTTITNGQAEEFIGYLFPLGATQILTDPSISQTLFIGLGDMVKANPTAPQVYASSIISVLNRRHDEVIWTMNSVPHFTLGNDSVPPVLIKAHMNPAYIGVKFMAGDITYVGWAKLEFNLTDGEPALITKRFALDDCLVDE